MQKLGGQAVIEGVMIKSDKKLSIAVRKPNKKIVVKEENLNFISAKFKKFIFIRGIITLVETLILGIKSLNYSANEAVNKKEEKINVFYLIIIIALSFAFGLLIFKFIPLLIAQFFYNNVSKNNILFNLIEGLFKIIIFVLYIFIISFMKDVKELFKYHGAEHKAVNCYENKENLTISNIRKYPTLNPRCGTSFIILVLFISIIIYTFLPNNIPFYLKLAYRISLLPLIAGVSYEVLKLSDKYQKSLFFNILIKPGLLIQKMTTKEPSDEQIEVALVALKKHLL